MTSRRKNWIYGIQTKNPIRQLKVYGLKIGSKNENFEKFENINSFTYLQEHPGPVNVN